MNRKKFKVAFYEEIVEYLEVSNTMKTGGENSEIRK